MNALETLGVLKAISVCPQGFDIDYYVDLWRNVEKSLTPSIEQEEVKKHFMNLMVSLSLECGISKWFPDDVIKLSNDFRGKYDRRNYKESIEIVRQYILQPKQTVEQEEALKGLYKLVEALCISEEEAKSTNHKSLNVTEILEIGQRTKQYITQQNKAVEVINIKIESIKVTLECELYANKYQKSRLLLLLESYQELLKEIEG